MLYIICLEFSSCAIFFLVCMSEFERISAWLSEPLNPCHWTLLISYFVSHFLLCSVAYISFKICFLQCHLWNIKEFFPFLPNVRSFLLVFKLTCFKNATWNLMNFLQLSLQFLQLRRAFSICYCLLLDSVQPLDLSLGVIH